MKNKGWRYVNKPYTDEQIKADRLRWAMNEREQDSAMLSGCFSEGGQALHLNVNRHAAGQ
jgi:hypothetical protein